MEIYSLLENEQTQNTVDSSNCSKESSILKYQSLPYSAQHESTIWRKPRRSRLNVQALDLLLQHCWVSDQPNWHTEIGARLHFKHLYIFYLCWVETPPETLLELPQAPPGPHSNCC